MTNDELEKAIQRQMQLAEASKATPPPAAAPTTAAATAPGALQQVLDRLRMTADTATTELASWGVSQPLKAAGSAVDGIRGLLTPSGQELANPNAARNWIDNTATVSNVDTAREQNRSAIGRAWSDMLGAVPVQPAARATTPTTATTSTPVVPTAADPAVADVAKQMSFDNTDVTPDLLSRINTISSGTAAQSTPQSSPVDDALLALVERLTPARSQATLIPDSTPRGRTMGADAAEEARIRRGRELDLAERGQAQAVTAAEAQREQQATTAAAGILTQLQAQRASLTQALAVVRAKASVLTPQGRKAAAEAQRIETMLSLLDGAARGGELTRTEALSQLTGQQSSFVPISDITGANVGAMNRGTAEVQLYEQDLLDRLVPKARN